MGWSGGTDVADGVWGAVKQYIPENKKSEVANKIINILEDMDWDCIEEAEELYEVSGRKAQDIADGNYDE
jgi:hypothetical protein